MATRSLNKAAGQGVRRQRGLNLFQLTTTAGLTLFVSIVSMLLIKGADYYLTPFGARAFHPLHQMYKPSGVVGRACAITGGTMMLLAFLYAIRKKWKFLQRFGSQSQWLRVHIFFGLGGPLLVTIHTTGKLAGVAAIGFYSMMAMVVSGIFGRYLYAKIPRTKRGSEMSLREIEQQMLALVNDLTEGKGLDRKDHPFLDAVEEFLARVRKPSRGLIFVLSSAVFDDLKTPWRFWQAWQVASLHTDSRRFRLKTARLILKQRRILKQLAILEACQRLFSYWHVFHRPFTVLAFVVIVIHIAVATYLGYGVRW